MPKSIDQKIDYFDQCFQLYSRALKVSNIN